jgi:hypothetical protein
VTDCGDIQRGQIRGIVRQHVRGRQQLNRRGDQLPVDDGAGFSGRVCAGGKSIQRSWRHICPLCTLGEGASERHCRWCGWYLEKPKVVVKETPICWQLLYTDLQARNRLSSSRVKVLAWTVRGGRG